MSKQDELDDRLEAAIDAFMKHTGATYDYPAPRKVRECLEAEGLEVIARVNPLDRPMPEGIRESGPTNG